METEINKKTFDYKAYMKQYRMDHPERWYKNNTCDVCGGKYMTCGKTNHLNTKKHQYAMTDNQLKEMQKLVSLIVTNSDPILKTH